MTSTLEHPSSPFSDSEQAWLAAIVTSSDDAIISKDLNSIIQSWNKSAERIFGYTADEVIGKPITILIPDERLDEEDYILGKIQEGERVEHFKTVRVRKDGSRVPVSATISPVRDSSGKIIGASKIVRDLSAGIEMEEMFKNIVMSSDDAIVAKDLNGVVRSWNAGAERVFGYTAAEMIGRPITTLIPQDRMQEEDHILSRIRRGERVDHFETIRVRKDGKLIDVSVTISPIRGPLGTVTGASKIARDITQIKAITREREQLLQSEQAARREAERVNRVKDEFLATLSHELRTPMNAILGWTQLLRIHCGPEDLKNGLETIERNARTQTHLIDDLLDVSRIISGKMRLDVQRVDLPSVVSDAIASVQPAADAKGVRLYKVIDPQAAPINGDANRLQQVVWNLLSNAIKFTPRGGQIQVFLRRVGSSVSITVSDSGQGIDPQFLPQLFARFSQADASTTRRHGGLGLGLAIVRHLIELHGGTVEATSQGLGMGSTFTITLPLSIVREAWQGDSVHPTSHVASVTDAINLSGVKALVVDDEPDARVIVKRILESCGATVFMADSAAKGLEMLQRERPTIVLCDIGMPDEDGYQLLRKMRALPPEQGGNVPAVALTAFARSEDRRRALMEGFQMHLPKPVESPELIAVVASLAGIVRRSRE
jgi:PAS domain S-box-containing protein